MVLKTNHSVDSLVQGIEAIISKNSSSFSDADIDLLRQCKAKLEAQDNDENDNQVNLEVIKITVEVLKVFANPDVIDLFKSMF